MQLRCLDGSQRELYFEGNNKARNKTRRLYQKTMVDEGVATYEESSLASKVLVEEGVTEADYETALDKGKGKGNRKGKGKGKGQREKGTKQKAPRGRDRRIQRCSSSWRARAWRSDSP